MVYLIISLCFLPLHIVVVTVDGAQLRAEESRAETASVENDISEHLVVITAILHQGCANPVGIMSNLAAVPF